MADFKHIVRVANTDLDGSKKIVHALTKIKGIGIMYANMVCSLTEVDKNVLAGKLPGDQIKKLDQFIQNPEGVPGWMKNRQKDHSDGVDKHLIGSNLEFDLTNIKRRLSKIKSYRGLRLAVGLTVRGQRTKGNFRGNKGKVVGVKRKKGAKSGRV